MKKPPEKTIELSISDAYGLAMLLWSRTRMVFMAKMLLTSYIAGHNNAVDIIQDTTQILKEAGFSQRAAIELATGPDDNEKTDDTFEESLNKELLAQLLNVLSGGPDAQECRALKTLIKTEGVEGFLDELDRIEQMEAKLHDEWETLTNGEGTTEEVFNRLCQILVLDDDTEDVLDDET